MIAVKHKYAKSMIYNIIFDCSNSDPSVYSAVTDCTDVSPCPVVPRLSRLWSSTRVPALC